MNTTILQGGRAAPACRLLPVTVENRWTIECFGPDGLLKWREAFLNRVPTVGLNALLANSFAKASGEAFGTGTGSQTTLSHTLASAPLKPGSLAVTAGAVVASDNGAGGLTGTGIAAGSTVNYQTGAVTVVYSSAPSNGLAITAAYAPVTASNWYLGLIGAAISDAAITSGQATLTSASNPWTAADVGRSVIVRGAGSGGIDLSTTILSRQSPGQVTLNANAGATVAGAAASWDLRPTDTMASHAPWPESAPYSNASRPAWSPGAVAGGSVDNSASVAVFTINVGMPTLVFGAFMCSDSTVSGTAGTLYGGGVFSGGNSRQVLSGDTLNVTVTASVTAS